MKFETKLESAAALGAAMFCFAGTDSGPQAGGDFIEANPFKARILAVLWLCVAAFLLAPMNGAAQDDVALWSSGTWNIGSLSNNGTFQWTTNFGIGSSQAVIGDYNGDGHVDLGEVQENPPYLYWYWNLNNGVGGWNKETSYTILGLSASDEPCTADFNGDGKTDIAVFRSGTWYISYAPCAVDSFATISASGSFDVSGDMPVPGDFNGDGISDLANQLGCRLAGHGNQ